MEAAWGCAPVETSVAFLWNEAVFDICPATGISDALAPPIMTGG